MADMTDAQASQWLRGASAGLKYLARMDEALTAALTADKRTADAQKAAGEAEGVLTSLREEITKLKDSKGEVQRALDGERAALFAAQQETQTAQRATQQAITDRASEISSQTKDSQDRLDALLAQTARAQQALEAAKAQLTAFHTKVAGLTQ